MRAVILAILLLPALAWASPLFEERPTQSPDDDAASEQREQDAAPRPDQSSGQQLISWIIVQQRKLHRQLAEGIEQLRDAPTAAAAATLILTSFLYGVFHAVGPGHGKAVITTYLLTHRQHLRRGIAMSFLAALFQGLTAIVAVGLVLFVAGRAAGDALGQTATLEQVSFALLTLLGLWLSGRALRSLWHLRGKSTADKSRSTPACCSGHNHHIDPHSAAVTGNRATMAATVLAVGARPCAGAILVLVVGQLMGIWAAGVAAVIAMSVGTGLTVAVLASLAVLARQWVSSYAKESSAKVAVIAHGFALAGGLLILGLGLILLTGSFTIPAPQHPLGNF
ncbi:high-affinity nickel-transporter [Halorhodospira halochloris]|uniref:Nickel/cobalt efflux system n=1 Tax=Halorhodospira halochloris TaxID=1052 RepID=A0A120N000_HALHR|nr:high frequency lysogenization protein HflD [Halorhodospira halochloris]MBK1652032.1 hypothetical protein [Halorhodospira halochloris]BAU58331.1 high-affinity nickel-transporter [Halorhodospira halochloris]